MPLASVLYELEPSIFWAQEYAAREIASRGVVIELNPSSNWRMTQSRSPSEIPFIAVLQRFGSYFRLHQYRQRRRLWHPDRERICESRFSG